MSHSDQIVLFFALIVISAIFWLILALDKRDRKRALELESQLQAEKPLRGREKYKAHRARRLALVRPRRRSLLSPMRALIAAIGVAAAVATFWPRLTVTPGTESFDPLEPYHIIFKIANTGIIPLTFVQPMFAICLLDIGRTPYDPPEQCHGSLQSRLAFRGWGARKLGIDEQETIRFEDVWNIRKGLTLSAADFSIIVAFYPWPLSFWPFHLEKEYRFQTRLEPNGKFSLISRPVEK